MDTQAKIYSVLSYLIDKKSRSKAFYLDQTGKEYHLLTDDEIVLLLTYDRREHEYELSTMNFIGEWIDFSLNQLLVTTSSPDYDLMWGHLNYFHITPGGIYDLYASEDFVYHPSYEADNTNEES